MYCVMCIILLYCGMGVYPSPTPPPSVVLGLTVCRVCLGGDAFYLCDPPFFGGVYKAAAALVHGERMPLWREHYAGGEGKRPVFRGCVHASVFVFLVAYSIRVGGRGVGWWRMCGLLWGKAVSYGASAGYHLCPCGSTESETWLLKLDLAGVVLAVWAPCSAFAVGVGEWVVLFVVMVGVSVLHWRAVCDQLQGGSRVARCVLLGVYFWFAVAQIGWHYGYGGAWLAGVACYVLAFCVSPPVHRHLPPAPWHREGRNGWHEDFHLLLVVADSVFGAMAVQFLRL